MDDTLQILVVEDNPTDVLLLAEALEEVRTSQFALRHVQRLEEALQCLHDQHFDVVLLDLGLPDSQGLATFARLQAEVPAIPILILSGLDDDALALQAVQDGAQDFLVKGRINGSVLSRTIRYGIERKRSEQRVLASEVGYRRLFETAQDGIFILDAETGTITDANPALRELLGYEVSEFVGKRLWEIGPFRDKAASQAAFATLLEKGYIRYDDLPLMARDGRQVDVEFVSNVYESGLKQVIQCNIRDITARKQAAAALQQANDELETRVAARTSELQQSNASLEIARDAADTANAAKSEFLSRMSHELRTPMNAILGFGQILEMRSLGPKESQSVEHILKAGRHLLQLINEVLDISRIEAGRASLSLEPVSVAAIVREAFDLVRPLAAQHRIQLANEVAPDTDWHVLADCQRLRQVLINLLANAVKYNCPDGVVTVACAESATGRVQIHVSDTGPGIAPADMAKLFIPFERLGAARAGVEGTGLGLALSRSLVDAMDGSLTANSVPGRGSVFTVDLPLAEPSPELMQALAASAARQAPRAAGRNAFTVLSIEDNPSNFQLIEAILEARPGISLVGAIQGSVGLDLARDHHPDLILLDLHLPDIMGWEVLRRLRASPDTLDIPVVIISADATEKQVERLLTPPEGHRGANAYLTKPLNVQELLRIVDTVLQDPVSRAGEGNAAVGAGNARRVDGNE